MKLSSLLSSLKMQRSAKANDRTPSFRRLPGLEYLEDRRLMTLGPTWVAPVQVSPQSGNWLPPVSIGVHSGGIVRGDSVSSDFGIIASYTFAAQTTDATGRVLVAGQNINDFQNNVTRYNTDGSLDKTFGDGGTALSHILHSFSGGLITPIGAKVALDSQGRILVTSYIGDAYYFLDNYMLTRFLPDGTPDPTFGDLEDVAGTGTSVRLAGAFNDPNDAASAPFSYSWTVTPSSGPAVTGPSGSLNAPLTAGPRDFRSPFYNPGNSDYLSSVPDLAFTAVPGRSYATTLTITNTFGVVTSQNRTVTVSSAIAGTSGNDIIQIDKGTTADTLKTTINGTVTDNIAAVGELFVSGLGGNDTITVNASLAGGMLLAGQDGSDTYNITFGANLLGKVRVVDDGATGTDAITVNGTPGNDVIFKNNAEVTISSPFQEQVLTTGIETRTIHGGTGSDTITDPGSDTFLFGDEGDDTIIIDATTGTGVSAFGGEGNDSYIINLGSLAGPVTVTDTAGSNTVQVIGTPGSDDLTLTSTATSSQLATGTGETINLNVGGATATALAIDGGAGTNNVSLVTVPGVSPPVQVTATHVALVIGMITAPVDPKQVSTIIPNVSASASFTEMDLVDSHTAVWDWGDGTGTSTGTVTRPISSATSSVTGSHAYSRAGVYTITLTVTDMYGASAQTVFQYIVIYDPSAGFVTGGGWINSPAGAYAANVLLTGKANFGFESKYQNGNSVPTGNTEFQFSVANFKFKSTAYEWLVVSGAKARYRGTGTVNGAGSYGFELTAWDGQVSGGGGVDKFRIKIWNQNQGNGVVYDNMMNAADGADPTTSLGGGSIVIHKSGSNLVLNAGANGSPSGSARLTDSQLSTGLADAIAAWETQDLTSTQLRDLQGLTVGVADLPGNLLGLASESTNYVWVDADAAGYGWSFTTEDLRSGGVDLLSVLTHELGHKLGYDHDVMGESLNVGERHLAMQHDRVIPYYAELGKLVTNGLGTLSQQILNRNADFDLDLRHVRSSSAEMNDIVDQSLADWSDDNSWAVGSNGHSILDERQSLRERKTLLHANDKLNEDLLDELAIAVSL